MIAGTSAYPRGQEPPDVTERAGAAPACPVGPP